MNEANLALLLAAIYEVEQSRPFRRLRAELERIYRRNKVEGYKQIAYTDSMFALLCERGFDSLSASLGR